MAIQQFDDSSVWQKSHGYAVERYQHFQCSKDFSVRNQICSAAVLISYKFAQEYYWSSYNLIRRSNNYFK